MENFTENYAIDASGLDKKKVKGFIFDMDGTIFDTEKLYGKCWFELMKEHGYIITEEMLNRMRGASIQIGKQIFEEVNPTYDYMEERKDRMKRVFEYVEKDGMPLMPGLITLMEYLKAHDYKVALGTSTVQPQVDFYMEKADTAKYFDFLGYGNLVEHGKPEPDLFLLCAEKLGLKPEECVVVEDSRNGVKAGRAAGMMVIGIPDLDDLTSVEPIMDAELSSLDHIITWLEK